MSGEVIKIQGKVLCIAHIESVSPVLRDRVLSDEADLVGIFGRKYKGLGWVNGDWFFTVRMVSGCGHEFHYDTEELCDIDREGVIFAMGDEG